MTKTIVGLFNTFSDAQVLVDNLLTLGIERDAISVFSSERPADQLQERELYGETRDSVAAQPEDASAIQGALGGMTIGGALGLLLGIGTLAIPGIGPVLAAGPLAAALGSTAVGAGLGGLIGVLGNAGISHDDALLYNEGLRRGGTLVSAHVHETMIDASEMAFERAGAVNIQQRAADWHAEGWTPNDPKHHDPDNRDLGDTWEDSSKVGTVGGAVAGAATGAAIGSVGGPVGTAIGGVAGAASGAVIGAAGDTAGEAAVEGDRVIDREYDRVEGRAYGYDNSDTWALHESDYRDDFILNYEPMGYSWDQYAQAYRYGDSFSADPQYRDYSWEQAEPHIRQNWDESLHGSWERFKDAVKYSWERAKQDLR
jgi:hypothetical protein